MKTFGYVRCSKIPKKTISGANYGRYGMCYVLRSAGDRVILFSPNDIDDPFLKNTLGVEVTSDFSKAAQCDVLIIEGSETAVRLLENREEDQSEFLTFRTDRRAVLKVLQYFGNRNVILQVADPLCPPCIIGETGSWQFGDYPTLPVLHGKSFLSLSEPLDHIPYLRSMNTARSPCGDLTQMSIPFVWNATFVNIYLQAFAKRTIAPFESRNVGLGYYGIAKNGRWEEGADSRPPGDREYGTVRDIESRLAPKGISFKIATRDKDIPASWGRDVFFVNPIEQLHPYISSLRAGLCLTDALTNRFSIPVMRTSEYWYFGTPIAPVPTYNFSETIVRDSVMSVEAPELRELVFKCLPKYILTGMTSTWEAFDERVSKLQEPGFFKQEQDRLVSLPGIEASDVYKLLRGLDFLNNESMPSRQARYDKIFARIKKLAEKRIPEGKEVADLLRRFYLTGQPFYYKRS